MKIRIAKNRICTALWRIDVMNEQEFREKLVRSLEEKKVHIISMGAGTFDCYVAGYGLVELKKLEWRIKYRRPTIEFTNPQTSNMKTLYKYGEQLPMVVLFAEEPERYYLLTPEDVALKLRTRMQYPTMWITEDRLLVKKLDSYEELLKAILTLLGTV
jgi:hypothetical protein